MKTFARALKADVKGSGGGGTLARLTQLDLGMNRFGDDGLKALLLAVAVWQVISHIDPTAAFDGQVLCRKDHDDHLFEKSLLHFVRGEDATAAARRSRFIVLDDREDAWSVESRPHVLQIPQLCATLAAHTRARAHADTGSVHVHVRVRVHTPPTKLAMAQMARAQLVLQLCGRRPVGAQRPQR